MILNGRDVAEGFKKKHANSRSAINAWMTKVQAASWKNFNDMKQTFNSVDKVGDGYIFNIGGNNYRLHARVSFDPVGIVRIVEIMTHAEYSKKSFQKG